MTRDLGNYQTMSDESINYGGGGYSGPTVCCVCGDEIDDDETYCKECSTRCDLCGRVLPEDEVLRIGDTAVCEDCREEYTP